MIDELGKSAKALLYERVTSPLLGAFSITWLLCNWRILAVLFSTSDNDTVYHKLDFIRDNLSDPKYLAYEPILTTLAILLVYPFLAAGATVVWEYGRHLKIKVRDHFDSKNSISADHARELKNLVVRLLEQQATSDDLIRGSRSAAIPTQDEAPTGGGEDGGNHKVPYRDQRNTEISWGQEYGELVQRDKFKKAMTELVKHYPNQVDSFETSFPDDYKYLYAFQLYEAYQGNRPRNKVTPKGQYFIKMHVMRSG